MTYADRVFDALGDRTRRTVLKRLRRGARSVQEIADGMDVSRPAVSQHLRVLLDSGLVTERRHGRERHYHLLAERLGPVRDWIAHYERFWDERLQRLQKLLEKKSQE